MIEMRVEDNLSYYICIQVCFHCKLC